MQFGEEEAASFVEEICRLLEETQRWIVEQKSPTANIFAKAGGTQVAETQISFVNRTRDTLRRYTLDQDTPSPSCAIQYHVYVTYQEG